MPAVDLVVFALGPTATYARRDAVFIPCHYSAYPDHRDGSLTLVLQNSRRAGAKVESDTYGVQEELDLGLPDGVRVPPGERVRPGRLRPVPVRSRQDRRGVRVRGRVVRSPAPATHRVQAQGRAPRADRARGHLTTLFFF